MKSTKADFKVRVKTFVRGVCASAMCTYAHVLAFSILSKCYAYDGEYHCLPPPPTTGISQKKHKEESKK